MSEQCEEGEVQDLLLRAEAAEAREKVKDEINASLIEQRDRLEAKAAKLRSALASLASPDKPEDMDNRELITAMMTAIVCTGQSDDVAAAMNALAVLRDTIPTTTLDTAKEE